MSETLEKAKRLISHAALVRQKYAEIERKTGANFNVFSILKLSTSENRTHSAFIAEMLNPKGSHGRGDLFLTLFLKRVREEAEMGDGKFEFPEFKTNGAVVIPEHPIGNISKDENSGGRIDLLMRDWNGNQMAIENKINAEDQPNQLIRYHEYLNSGDKKHPLLYLTLDGRKATDGSAGTLKPRVDYLPISYQDTILNWLSDCQKEVTNVPSIREGIAQYMNLIKQLTNRTMLKEEENELAKWIFNTNQFDTARSIAAAVHQVQLLYYESLKDGLEEIHETIQHVKVHGKLGEANSNIILTLTDSDFSLWIYFSNFNDLQVGIHSDGKKYSMPLVENLHETIGNYYGLNVQDWPVKGNGSNPWLWVARVSLSDLSPQLVPTKGSERIFDAVKYILTRIKGLSLKAV